MTPSLSSGLLLAVPAAPLAGAVLAGLFGRQLGRAATHWITCLGVAIALAISVQTLLAVIGGARLNATIYEWMQIGGLKMEVGFLVDGLTAMMMCVVTFVSLMVVLSVILVGCLVFRFGSARAPGVVLAALQATAGPGARKGAHLSRSARCSVVHRVRRY